MHNKLLYVIFKVNNLSRVNHMEGLDCVVEKMAGMEIKKMVKKGSCYAEDKMVGSIP